MDTKSTSQKRVTLNAVNAALLAEFGPGIELVKGNGYFWFSGDQCVRMKDQSVPTAQLGSQPIESWLQDARDKLAAIEPPMPSDTPTRFRLH